jgi:DNA-binding NarL/FixJ family response regulator
VRAIRVALADDDKAFRDALVDVLEVDPRFRVVGAHSTGVGVAGMVADLRPDLVLLDVRMSSGGAQAARAVRAAGQSSGRVPVVVALSADSTRSTVVTMLREGATGYLLKGSIGSGLPDLLARCAAGETVLRVPGAAEALRAVEGAAPPSPDAD